MIPYRKNQVFIGFPGDFYIVKQWKYKIFSFLNISLQSVVTEASRHSRDIITAVKYLNYTGNAVVTHL